MLWSSEEGFLSEATIPTQAQRMDTDQQGKNRQLRDVI